MRDDDLVLSPPEFPFVYELVLLHHPSHRSLPNLSLNQLLTVALQRWQLDLQLPLQRLNRRNELNCRDQRELRRQLLPDGLLDRRIYFDETSLAEHLVDDGPVNALPKDTTVDVQDSAREGLFRGGEGGPDGGDEVGGVDGDFDEDVEGFEKGLGGGDWPGKRGDNRERGNK